MMLHGILTSDVQQEWGNATFICTPKCSSIAFQSITFNGAIDS
jgi:hypothetical protein